MTASHHMDRDGVAPTKTPEHRGCSEAKKAELLALAERCERDLSNFALERAIAAAVGFVSPTILPPAYTSSLDAAVTLVPRSAIWSAHGSVGSKGFADVSTTQEPHYFKADAATPALALCAAALRARAGAA